MIRIEMSYADLTTVQMSLHGWISRCKSEAALMEKWAAEETDPKLAEKCRKNAEAGRRMHAEALDLLNRLRSGSMQVRG